MVDPPPLLRPIPGPVRSTFRYDRRRPFTAGQRRGVTFVARPGVAVTAPCRGRVSFAGRTPRGAAVTVRCGTWTTTVLGVAPTVRAGAAVAAGRTVGRASGGAVGLSLRPVGDRWGYVDPHPSVAAPPRGGPLGPAPRGRRGPVPSARPVPVPRAVPTPRPASPPSPVGSPLPLPIGDGRGPAATSVEPDPGGGVRADPRVVAVGLALAALGLPVLRRRSSGRRVAARRARYLPSVDR